MVTVREARALQAIAAGKDPGKAVKSAGYNFSPDNAKQFGESLKKRYLDANGELLVALEDVGVDLRFVAKTIKEGLEATTFVKTGKNVYTERSDANARHRYLETALDIIPGARSPKKIEVEQLTFEKRVSVVERLKANPQAGIEILQKMISSKQSVTER
jgi:hypothetical protein